MVVELHDPQATASAPNLQQKIPSPTLVKKVDGLDDGIIPRQLQIIGVVHARGIFHFRNMERSNGQIRVETMSLAMLTRELARENWTVGISGISA